MLALELTILSFQEINFKKRIKNHGWTINTTQNVERGKAATISIHSCYWDSVSEFLDVPL